MKDKGKNTLLCHFFAYREKNITTNLMKHKGKIYLVVTFLSPIGKKMLQQTL